MAPDRRWRTARGVVLWGAGALLGHALVLDRLGEALQGLAQPEPMERMEAVFTRVLQPTAPAQVSGAVRPRGAPVRRGVGAVPARASEPAAGGALSVDPPPASDAIGISPAGPDGAASDVASSAAVDTADERPQVLESPTPSEPLPSVGIAASSEATAATLGDAASATAASDFAASGASSGDTALRWPRSTRLSYTLGGWYRGEVHGQATVEWLRRDGRYQVHLDIQIGPKVAPLIARRLSSEGTLSDAHGLRPRRFEQDTRQMFSRQRVQIAFDEQGVRIGQGPRLPREEGMQDSASQFIQMMYLLTASPDLARPGSRVDFALVLPSRVQRWSYRVGQRERVDTAQGPIEALHVVPLSASGRGVLSAEVWYAPSLQWLPVRMRMKQDDETWVDLVLARPPEQE